MLGKKRRHREELDTEGVPPNSPNKSPFRTQVLGVVGQEEAGRAGAGRGAPAGSAGEPQTPASVTAQGHPCPRARHPPASTHLIEEALGELLEALGAHEALLVVQLAVAIDDLLGGREASPAALTAGVGQGVGHVAATHKGHRSRRAALPGSSV